MTKPETVIREDIRSLRAYHVAPADGLLKLDAMESPYAMPEQLTDQWLRALRDTALNRYPDASMAECSSRLAKQLNLSDQYDVLWGNGSDELIQILIQSIASNDAVVMSPTPSFVMYQVVSLWNRVQHVGIDLDENFDIDIPAWRDAIATHQPAIIFLAQPNNPTGNLFSETAVEQIIEMAPGLVVLDEAYLAYSSRDHQSYLDRYKNVVVMRTLSKEGFAGIRLGYLIAHSSWVTEFNKLRMPYNVNSLTQTTAALVLNHLSEISERAELIVEERGRLTKQLSQLGLITYPSEANFIVAKSAYLGADVVEAMKTRGVLIKSLCGSHPLLTHCVRITVSSKDDNDIMLEALEASLDALKQN
ncbi:MAG: histidinol-phosphate transaminase [Gammaproteobacteria bacterium]|nr:histidinol-phosphate transaminase [Gammaproteobacteria bacterium]